MNEFISKIKEKWQMIVSVTFIVTAIFFSITAFIPPKYTSEVSLMVIQKQPSYDVDAFAAAKSAEYLSDVFSKVIYSETFLNDVLEAPYEINTNFSSLPEERKEEWKDMIDIKKINNTGILNVIVYSRYQEEAENIAKAVVWSYEIRGQKYHGGGDRVKIELIDGPITSERPAEPNLLLNTFLGLVVGLVGAMSLAYFVDDFDLKIFRKRDDYENYSKKDNQKRQEIVDKIMDLKKRFQEKGKVTDLEKNYDEKIVLDKEDLISEEEFSKQKNNEKEMENAQEGFRILDEKEEKDESSERKSAAPENLPFMQEDSKKDDFVDTAELEKTIEKEVEGLDNKEPSENEVKERLNKLLKGDL